MAIADWLCWNQRTAGRQSVFRSSSSEEWRNAMTAACNIGIGWHDRSYHFLSLQQNKKLVSDEIYYFSLGGACFLEPEPLEPQQQLSS